MRALLDKTAEHEAVAPDYVIEQLVVELFRRHPEAVAWLDRQEGEGMRLAEALKDWVDLVQTR